MDELIGEGRPIRTELDYLVACIEHMRYLQGHDITRASEFQKEMEEYFRLDFEMRSSFIYDELLRLSSTKAGTLKGRDPKVLKKLNEMIQGENFTLDSKPCTFIRHNRCGGEGWLSYLCDEKEQTMEYHEAWSLATEGRMILG